MAQVTDYTVSNQTFPNTRADINNIFAAIATNNSGTSAPSNQQAGQWWIDTTSSTWVLYIHDGTDDIQFATIDTSANTVNFTDSALDVVTDTTPQLGGNLDLNSNDITGTGNINITGNITASGNLAGTLTTASQPNITSVGTLTGLTTTGDINFGDNDKAVFGAGSDLQIYHDGSNSFIKDEGAGELKITTNGTAIQFQKGVSEIIARFVPDGNNELYHDNSKKLETTSTGATVTGNLSVTGNIYTSEGSETTPALQLNDPDTGLFDAGANAIGFTTNGSEKVRIVQGGSVGIGTTNPGQKLHVEGSIYTSGSLYVGGTVSANALNDYEEGTFTPTWQGTVSNPTIPGYNIQNGNYTKIGNMVYARLELATTGTPSGGNGNLLIAGLPFTPTNFQQPTGNFTYCNDLTAQTNQSDFCADTNGANTTILVSYHEFSGNTSYARVPVSALHNLAPRMTVSIVYQAQ